MRNKLRKAVVILAVILMIVVTIMPVAMAAIAG